MRVNFEGSSHSPEELKLIRANMDLIGTDNLSAYLQLKSKLNKDFYVLSGNDSLILKTLEAGGAGGIAGCANVYPEVLSSIYRYFAAGDIQKAKEAQDSIASLRAVFRYGNPNTIIKKAVRMLGYSVGECRRPFNYLCPEGVQALQAVLNENNDKGMK